MRPNPLVVSCPRQQGCRAVVPDKAPGGADKAPSIRSLPCLPFRHTNAVFPLAYLPCCCYSSRGFRYRQAATGVMPVSPLKVSGQYHWLLAFEAARLPSFHGSYTIHMLHVSLRANKEPIVNSEGRGPAVQALRGKKCPEGHFFILGVPAPNLV